MLGEIFSTIMLWGPGVKDFAAVKNCAYEEANGG
jgi:hypothetical protein